MPSGFVEDERYPHLGGNMIGGDPRTACPDLWAELVRRYKVRTVYDVGCGEGHAMRAFALLGCHAIGIDGLERNVAMAAAHGQSAHVGDLSRAAFPLHGIDLVWCSEVVEHVAEEHLDNLLDTIGCGRVLAMTHAVPGQGGHHHVNEQHATYWIKHIEARGLALDRAATTELRPLGGPYWRATGLIFVRSES